jgi:ion channel-forming bestrophin family protein
MLKILYQQWLISVIRLTQSHTLRNVFVVVSIFGIISSAICWVELHSGLLLFRIPSNIFTLLGIALSVLLAFRTNTAYDRWWEGRKLWGALINASRNTALYVAGRIPHHTREKLLTAAYISNFAFLLKDTLQNTYRFERLLALTPEQMETMRGAGHKPGYMQQQFFQLIFTLRTQCVLDDHDVRNLKDLLLILTDVCGSCERIHNTPIPFSYSVYIRLFVTLYCLLLPLGLVAEYGYYTIPLVMFVAFAMVGLEMLAEEVEDPFNGDEYDLPLVEYAHTIRHNVHEILNLPHPSFDKEQYEDICRKELYSAS